MLLAVHCKKTDSVDFKTPIWNYIAATYSEHQANDAADDLATVQQLRSEIVGLTGSLPQLHETICKYYRALCLMETRFPISRDAGHIPLSFVWYDAFRHTKKTEQCSIHFEKAAVLFNLAAVLTQQALNVDRSTDTGRKEAAKYFQEAAGTFAELRDVVSLRVEAPRPVDVSPEAANMLEKLCLAQAQEVTFEKFRADGKSPSILARLSRQVSMYYDDVASVLPHYPLSQHFDRSWTAHVAVKAALYEAESQMQAAAAQRAEDNVNVEITRLKEAQKALGDAKRDIKQTSKELNAQLAEMEESLGNQLRRAERENSTVYLMRVPNIADLPVIQPHSVAKSVVPAALDASQEQLFREVIPDGSAKALSRYTDMVDALIREQNDRLTAASDDARLRLRERDLPDCLQALDAGTAAVLPEGLRSELEQLEESGGVRHLNDLKDQIQGLRRVAVEELGRVESELKKEAADDSAQRERHGAAWNRPSSAALNSTLMEKIAGYKANLAAAGESDGRLEARLAQNTSAFSALSLDNAVAAMPRLQAPMVNTGTEEPAQIVTKLRQALDAIGRLSSERAALEEALKVEKNKDNILPRIMAVSGSYDKLFAEELKKYDPLKAQVEENLAKQAQVMEVIDRETAAYKQAFGYNEWRAACETAATEVRRSLAGYKEVRDNMSEGLRFYMSLQEAIAVLAQQAGDYALTRSLQRDDMLEDMRRSTDAASQRARAAEEAAAREKAQQSLNALNLSAGGPPPYSAAPHNYPPPQQHQAPQPQPFGGGAPTAFNTPAPAPGPPPAHQYPPPPQYYHHPQQPYQQQNQYPPQQPQQQQGPPYGYHPQGPQQQSQQPYYQNPYQAQGGPPYQQLPPSQQPAQQQPPPQQQQTHTHSNPLSGWFGK
ncbi:g1109 [Coccomyxa elongata]